MLNIYMVVLEGAQLYSNPSYCKWLLQGLNGIIVECVYEHNKVNVFNLLYLAFLYLNAILFFFFCGVDSCANFHVLS